MGTDIEFRRLKIFSSNTDGGGYLTAIDVLHNSVRAGAVPAVFNRMDSTLLYASTSRMEQIQERMFTLEIMLKVWSYTFINADDFICQTKNQERKYRNKIYWNGEAAQIKQKILVC